MLLQAFALGSKDFRSPINLFDSLPLTSVDCFLKFIIVFESFSMKDYILFIDVVSKVWICVLNLFLTLFRLDVSDKLHCYSVYLAFTENEPGMISMLSLHMWLLNLLFKVRGDI